MSTRLEINILDEYAEFLRAEAALSGTSVTDAVGTAIGLLKWYRDETRKGNLVLTEDPHGTQHRMVLQ